MDEAQPIPVGSTRIEPGGLWINDAINAAVDRARAEQQVIYLRRATDGSYDMLIQATSEINPLEDERRKPKTIAVAKPDGSIEYTGAR